MSLDGVVERPSAWSRFDAEMGAMISAGLAEVDAVLIGTATYREFAAIWPSQGDGVPMAALLNRAPHQNAPAIRQLDSNAGGQRGVTSSGGHRERPHRRGQ